MRKATPICSLLLSTLVACGGGEAEELRSRYQLDGLPLPEAELDAPYEAQLQLRGGPVDAVQWVLDGRLPEGIRFTPQEGGGARFEGTPTRAGPHALDLRVLVAGEILRRELELDVLAPLQLSNPNLPEAEAEAFYRVEVGIVGGQGAVEAGLEGLPSGLSFEVEDRNLVIYGTTDAVGTHRLAVALTDARSTEARFELELVVAPAGLGLVWPEPAGGPVGERVQLFMAVERGVPPYTWSVALPSGLPGLEAACATTDRCPIVGVVEAPGRHQVQVQVIDGDGVRVTGTLELEFRQRLELDGLPLPIGTVGEAYAARLGGGVGDETWRLPVDVDGLRLEARPQGAELLGVPTQAAVHMFELEVVDPFFGLSTHPMELTVHAPLMLPDTAVRAVLGQPVQSRFEASGGDGQIELAAVGGELPPGLELTVDGGRAEVTGTAGREGRFELQVEARDGAGRRTLATWAVDIAPSGDPLRIVLGPSARGRACDAVFSPASATGGSGLGLSWSVLDPLPPGLRLARAETSSSGVGGLTSEVGTHRIRIQVTDSNEEVAVETLQLEVEPGDPAPRALALTTGSVQVLDLCRAHPQPIWSVTRPTSSVLVSPDGQHLAARTSTAITLYRLQDGQRIHTLPSVGPLLMSFSPDGSRLFFDDFVLQPTLRRAVFAFELASLQTTELALEVHDIASPDGAWLLGSVGDRLWVVRTDGSQSIPLAPGFLPDDDVDWGFTYHVPKSGGDELGVWVWDRALGVSVPGSRLELIPGRREVMARGPSGSWTRYGLDAAGGLVSRGSFSRCQLRVLDADWLNCDGVFHLDGTRQIQGVNASSIGPRQRWLLAQETTGTNQTVLLDLSQDPPLRHALATLYGSYRGAFSPDGRWLFIRGEGILELEPPSGGPRWALPINWSPTQAIVWGPYGMGSGVTWMDFSIRDFPAGHQVGTLVSGLPPLAADADR